MPKESIARISPVLARTSTLGFAVCVAVASPGLSLSAHAAAYTVLYSFTGKPNDGAYPDGLVRDDAGNLYGMTDNGGPYDLGTAFRLDTAGNETILTNFDYANGAIPQLGLIMHKRTLYDTTSGGGYNGQGAVVKINDRGKATLIYSFCSLANCADGYFPTYGVTRDNAGSLYGTTSAGGAYGAGTVFKVDSGGNETVLYSFCPNGGTCSDGETPLGTGALRDSGGNLYGEAQGGDGWGVVWKLDASGNESVLHAFTGPPYDGSTVTGQLTSDGAGDLYGITRSGGSGTACGQSGCGTVFKVDASGNETVLYSFMGGADGAEPSAQSLVLDKKGNLYGTAIFGGAYGDGTAFKLHTSGKLTVLYSFQGQSDGGLPASGLLLKQGALYGEASVGGDLNCSENPGGGCGVMFKITP